MAMTKIKPTYTLHRLPHHRSHNGPGTHVRWIQERPSSSWHAHYFKGDQPMQSTDHAHGVQQSNLQRNMVEKHQPADNPRPQKPKVPLGLTWVFWSILYIIEPLSKLKEGKLLRSPGPLGEVGKMVETVEIVAEIVDDVADATEKVCSEAADIIPDKYGTLKDGASMIEHAAQEVSKGAEFILDVTQKFDELEERINNPVEMAAEIIEDVAEITEKVSSAVGDSLPSKDSSTLKDTALMVEHVSKELKEVSQDAKRTLDFIDKVDELKERIERP